MQFFKRDINKQNRNGEVTFYNVGDSSSQSSSGGVTLDQVRRNFVSIEFFKKLFQAHDSTDSENILNIDPNDTDSTITDLELKFGSWSSYFISALGRNSSGGGGGGSVGVLNDLDDVDTTGVVNGNVLTYQNGMWVPGTGGGGGGSVSWADITGKPTTLSGYGITDAIPLGGSNYITGTLRPNTNNSIDLGSSSYRWRYVYGVNGSFSSSLTVGGTDVSLDGHTHSASDITSGTFAVARIPSLAASKITSGVFDVARIPTGISITGNAATATTASKLGSSTVGSATKGIYLSSGTPTAMTYALNADVNSSTENYLAYYSGTNVVSGTSFLKRIYESNSLNKALRGVEITGTGLGNAADLISGTDGVLSYGDGGPQIRFTPTAEQHLALIATHYDVAGGGASLHLVSDQSRVVFTTQEVVARTRLSVGVNVPNTTYPLYVAGNARVNRLYLASGVYFEADSTGVHLVGAGFYSDSFISALGANSGGGGVTTLEALEDVQYTGTPTNGQALIYNGSVWTNGAVSTTDTKVTQTATTTSAAYEILFSATADNQTRTEGARKTSYLTYNPSTKALSTGGTINGYTLGATSITTSTTNIPTSNAVKTFVEGKGYVTTNSTYKLTLNGTTNGTSSGTSLGSLYAPTGAGTSGYVLQSNGSGAPSWVAQSTLSVGTANKLGTSNVGSTTRPIYLNAGTPTQCGTSLAVDITGNAASATKATQDGAGNTITSKYVTLDTTQTITGTKTFKASAIYIGAGTWIDEEGGNGLLVYKPSGNSTISSSQWGVGAGNCQGVIRSSANHLVHYRGDTNYNILDTYNAPKWTLWIYPESGTPSFTGSITSNSDLNDYLDAGAYYCQNGTTAATLSNTPYTAGNFRLWNIYNSGSNGASSGSWFAQLILAPNSGDFYIRPHNNNSFGSWARLFKSTGGSITGHLYLDGASASSSTGNTSQIVFRASSTQQVAISSNTNALIINPTSSTTTGQWVIGVNGHNTYSTGSGNFGIGISPTQKLHVDGNILATGGVTALSDMRQKTFVAGVKEPLENLAALPIFYFKWKDESRDDYMHIGTSAQAVREIYPELVLGKDELSVDYGVLGTTIGILNSRALVTHEQRIKALESRIETLEERR